MLGYHTWLFKYFTFIITQLIAAIAGLLSCYYRGIAAPDDFSFITMGSFILMVLIGGQRTMVGPIIGAFFVTFITHYLSSYTNEWMGILGIIFIIVVMFAQKGIGGYLTEWYYMIQSKMIKQ
jgi:branched-chain amino acid transport system permease protein